MFNKLKGQHHGLIVYVKKSIYCTQFDIDTNSYENLGIIIDKIAIFNVYISPGTKIITNDLKTLLNTQPKVAIIGDHNAKHQNWNNTRANANGNILNKFIQTVNATIEFPEDSFTHYPEDGNQPSTLDFAITKNLQTEEIKTENSLSSDHIPVIITLKLNSKLEINQQTNKYTDWNKFRVILNQKIQINSNINTKEKITDEVKQFSKIITDSFNASTTIKTINNKIKLPDNLKNIIKYKNLLRKRYQTIRNPQIKTEINRLTNHINKEINTLKTAKWEEVMNKISPKSPQSLWRIAKALKRKNNQNIIPAMQSKNGLVLTSLDKANIIAECFRKTHMQNSTRQQLKK